jgi:hypothetical protein
MFREQYIRGEKEHPGYTQKGHRHETPDDNKALPVVDTEHVAPFSRKKIG